MKQDMPDSLNSQKGQYKRWNWVTVVNPLCHPLAASSQPTTAHLFFINSYLQDSPFLDILTVARVPKFFLKRVSPTHLLGDILGARATFFLFFLRLFFDSIPFQIVFSVSALLQLCELIGLGKYFL